MHGHGLFNWWGFSPALNLFNYVNSKCEETGVVQVLLVGAGDPRHLLMTIASMSTQPSKRLKVYILEAQVELYARLLLLLGVCLEHGLGLRERSNLLLDLWGNLCLRPISKDYLRVAAKKLCLWVTDAEKYSSLLGLVSCSRLKYRERDALDAICRSWYSLSQRDYDPPQAWDVRLRQFFKTRYDYRQADAEWAWHMRMSFRLQDLPGVVGVKKGSDVDDNNEGKVKDNRDGYVGVGKGWGQEFLEWRESGNAFVTATDSKPILANTSLASAATISDGTSRHRRVGYWGDLLTGPFPALALASTSPKVIEKENGRSKYNGTQIAQWNMESMLENLWRGVGGSASVCDSPSSSESQSESSSESNTKSSVESITDSTDGTKSESSDPTSTKSSEEVSNLSTEGTTTESRDVTGESASNELNTSSSSGTSNESSNETSSKSCVELNNGSSASDSVPEDESKRNCGSSSASSSDESDSTNDGSTNKVDEELEGKRMGSPENDKAKEKEEYTKKNEWDPVEKENEHHDSEQPTTKDSCESRDIPQHPKETKEEEKITAEGYLKLDGVEIVLLSPTRMNDLSSLPEIPGGLDLVYLSVATAHLLTPSLTKTHLLPNTRLLLETARMFPELTDEQVVEYETRLKESANDAGWILEEPPPLCHLYFTRK